YSPIQKLFLGGSIAHQKQNSQTAGAWSRHNQFTGFAGVYGLLDTTGEMTYHLFAGGGTGNGREYYINERNSPIIDKGIIVEGSYLNVFAQSGFHYITRKYQVDFNLRINYLRYDTHNLISADWNKNSFTIESSLPRN